MGGEIIDMGREDCIMMNFVNKECYCDFYDYMFARCIDIKTCPEGLDRDDYEDRDNYDEGDEE